MLALGRHGTDFELLKGLLGFGIFGVSGKFIKNDSDAADGSTSATNSTMQDGAWALPVKELALPTSSKNNRRQPSDSVQS
jgi:hypothetical protein